MPRAAIDPTTGVTAQQEHFAYEYAMCGRPVVAYRRAYNTKGKLETCEKEARQLLHNPRITPRVEHYRKMAETKLEATVGRIAQELSRIAFFDLGKLMDDEGNPIPLHEMDEDTRRALNGVDIQEVTAGTGADRVVVGNVKKYRQVPKVEALRILAQWKKMLVEQKEIGTPGEFEKLALQMTDDQLKREAEERLTRGVKLGYVRLLPSKRDGKRAI